MASRSSILLALDLLAMNLSAMKTLKHASPPLRFVRSVTYSPPRIWMNDPNGPKRNSALPRVLTLNGQGDLEMSIAPVAQSLRAREFTFPTSGSSSAERAHALRSVRIANLAGEFTWNTGSEPFSFTIADATGPWWSLRIARSGSTVTLLVNDKSIEFVPQSSDELKFHLLLDASLAEFFCDDLHVLTSRSYRKPSGPRRLQVTDSDLSSLREFSAWQLRPISADRLTS
jgi:sucrose-6-phosphate hydrolase SacC (GH32 family)